MGSVDHVTTRVSSTSYLQNTSFLKRLQGDSLIEPLDLGYKGHTRLISLGPPLRGGTQSYNMKIIAPGSNVLRGTVGVTCLLSITRTPVDLRDPDKVYSSIIHSVPKG